MILSRLPPATSGSENIYDVTLWLIDYSMKMDDLLVLAECFQKRDL